MAAGTVLDPSKVSQRSAPQVKHVYWAKACLCACVPILGRKEFPLSQHSPVEDLYQTAVENKRMYNSYFFLFHGKGIIEDLIVL